MNNIADAMDDGLLSGVFGQEQTVDENSAYMAGIIKGRCFQVSRQAE
jgi:hypothetical protein